MKEHVSKDEKFKTRLLEQPVGFEKLEVYQVAYKFVVFLFKILDKIDSQGKREILSQLRRSALSIPLNIAEGSASLSKREYLNQVNYAYKSAAETKVNLLVCKELGYLPQLDLKEVFIRLDEVKRRVWGLRFSLIRNSNFKVGDRFKFHLKRTENDVNKK